MNYYEQVYAVVRQIPAGKVTSYGRIANMLGRPRAARAVGYALNALKDRPDQHSDVPWWRVINAEGRISTVNRELSASKQATYLKDEGVTVDETLRIDLALYLWQGLSLMEIDEILVDDRSQPE